jgi:hypothetical protein
MLARRSSGRPRKGEYADYGQTDIDLVEGDDAVAALEKQRRQTVDLFEEFGEEGGSLAYAPDKWTIRQVLGHLADDERIYAYRALCIARADARPLPGFDEKAYAQMGSFDSRPMRELLADYEAVRSSIITRSCGSGTCRCFGARDIVFCVLVRSPFVGRDLPKSERSVNGVA